jgi:AcrR family transcriptional regulator
MPGANVAAVAAEAGVSRPTVYRYFEDQQALVEATLLHAARELTGVSARGCASSTAGGDGRRDAAFHAREFERAVLGAMWSAAALTSALASITRRSVLAWSRHAVKDLVRAAGWAGDAADEAVEVMLRMLLSLLAAPEPRRSDAALRAFLMRRLVPALGLAPPRKNPSR